MATSLTYGIAVQGKTFAAKAAAVPVTAIMHVRREPCGPITRWWIHWLGDGTYEFEPGELAGVLYRAVTAPSSPAPTDNYDVTLISALGVDALNGDCADRDTANVETAWPCYVLSDAHAQLPSTHCRYRLTVANAGEEAQGVIELCTIG